MLPDKQLRASVEGFMARVPEGRVTTYGDLATLAGHPHASRVVGGIAHFGDPSLPWHRLVNRFGGLAAGFHGGREAQQQLLEAEGITCTDFIVDNFKEHRWQPDELYPQTRLL
jgi:methylated-DNA-protein-cysteine methyltransferase-like protein